MEDFQIYSQICIKRSPLGQRKSDLIRQVTSKKRFNSYEVSYDKTRKGDLLIQVTAWRSLVLRSHMPEGGEH
jgi:hypothetical protein